MILEKDGNFYFYLKINMNFKIRIHTYFLFRPKEEIYLTEIPRDFSAHCAKI